MKTTKNTDISDSQGKMFIISGMLGLVENEGCTPHEVFDILDGLKKDVFHALAEIHRERRDKE